MRSQIAFKPAVVVLAAAVAIAASLSLVLSAADPAAGARTKLCKNTYGGDVIAAKDLKCKRARRVVRAWAEGYKIDGNPDREVLGFACRGITDDVEGLTIRCTRSGKRVAFYANVP